MPLQPICRAQMVPESSVDAEDSVRSSVSLRDFLRMSQGFRGFLRLLSNDGEGWTLSDR